MKRNVWGSWNHDKTVGLFFWIFILIGIFARVWQFGLIPADINQDEAFAGYEAYSLLHYGMDSSGYHFPVYLTAWGSGMNALNTYLMIPFMAIFGPEVWVIRLPQLIVSCCSLWVIFLFVKRLVNTQTALFSLLLLAICPWHIYLSRWGLESNLAPGFLLFGLYFFVRGLENSRLLPVSALMYGLSLYAYATIWPVVPVIILVQFIYSAYYKKISVSRDLLLSCLILALFALPLLLFLMVNYGVIEELRFPLFSIPKLVYMRSNEISLSNIVSNAKNLWNIVVRQTTVRPGEFSAASWYGLFTRYTLPFFVLGLFYYVKQTVKHFRNREFGLDIFLLVQLLAGIVIGLLIHVNITRVNILFLPMVIIAATGVCWFCGLIHQHLILFVMPLYLIQFILFEQYYFTNYQEGVSDFFDYGIGEAVNEAMSHDGEIYVSSSVKYPKILFFSREPADEYLETVQYTNYPASFLEVRSFGRFHFGIDVENPDPDCVYILQESPYQKNFADVGFTLETYGNFVVAFCDQ